MLKLMTRNGEVSAALSMDRPPMAHTAMKLAIRMIMIHLAGIVFAHRQGIGNCSVVVILAATESQAISKK
jgi:hypothetical protein